MPFVFCPVEDENPKQAKYDRRYKQSSLGKALTNRL
jgi:hypothetical protein